jgi:hypothetical protein
MSSSPFNPAPSLLDDRKTYKRLELNHRRNLAQDQTEHIDAGAAAFAYAACKDEAWNPEPFSLLWGTPIWDQASAGQRVLLNQLYWVAYYAQIISAEIATIYFNQTSAAAMYGMEDFRLVCDTLDLESAQERAHINAFKTIGEATEHALFGRRIFTYGMRDPFRETMIHSDAGALRRRWKTLQLKAFGLLSAGSAFIGCQYFTVRGVRTLNGKIVQHQLSRYFDKHPDQAASPIPSRVSYHHFQDESYHFNTSMMVSQDVVASLPRPTRFERMVIDTAMRGCQKDHFHFSTAVNGIFWYDPSLFGAVYQVLRSPHFGLDRRGALDLMARSFGEENDGNHASARTHATARESYRKYLADMDHLSGDNREMTIMARSDLAGHLRRNRAAMARFCQAAPERAEQAPLAPVAAPTLEAA